MKSPKQTLPEQQSLRLRDTSVSWNLRTLLFQTGNRINILHLIPGNLYGGVETFLVALVRYQHLCPEMQHTFVLCYEGRLSEELRGEGANLCFVPPARLSRPWTVLRSRRSLADRLKAMTPDVVVSHHVWPLVVFGPVLKTFNSPVCVYLHGPMSGSGFLERSAARQRPSRVIGVSRHTLASFRPYFPAVPSEVIHYPMPFPARDFEMTCEDKQQLRESLRTSRDSIVILQASRIEERKGLDNLLTALHSLLDIPNWVCWIAGGSQRSNEAKYLVALQRQTSILGLENRVRFLGERQDVQRLMGTSDIYCQGNRGPEGFSLAFLEALSASLPIVTTAIGGAPEMIDDSCGRLVTVDKPTALSDRLRELISDVSLRQRLGAAGAKRARQLSDPVNQLERIRSAFTSTIASHDPDRESCKVLPVVADKRRERMSV